MKRIAHYRSYIQLFFSALVFYILVKFSAGLAIVFGASLLLGTVFGKMFCKWMCPVGMIMEFMMRNMDSTQQKHHMYNYFKMCCPISWIQGILNRFSLVRIKRDATTCTACGLCDKACYITTLNTDFSIYKTEKKDPALAFNCSKCLECIDSCPQKSLDFKI